MCINHKLLLWFIQTSTSPKRTVPFTSGYVKRSEGFLFENLVFLPFVQNLAARLLIFCRPFLGHSKQTTKWRFTLPFRQRKSIQSISDATLSSSESESLTSISGNNTCLVCPLSSESRRELLGFFGSARAFVLSSPSSSSDEDHTSHRSKSIETYGN